MALKRLEGRAVAVEARKVADRKRELAGKRTRGFGTVS
jgi:hypothetical protein